MQQRSSSFYHFITNFHIARRSMRILQLPLSLESVTLRGSLLAPNLPRCPLAVKWGLFFHERVPTMASIPPSYHPALLTLKYSFTCRLKALINNSPLHCFSPWILVRVVFIYLSVSTLYFRDGLTDARALLASQTMLLLLLICLKISLEWELYLRRLATKSTSIFCFFDRIADPSQ